MREEACLLPIGLWPIRLAFLSGAFFLSMRNTCGKLDFCVVQHIVAARQRKLGVSGRMSCRFIGISIRNINWRLLVSRITLFRTHVTWKRDWRGVSLRDNYGVERKQNSEALISALAVNRFVPVPSTVRKLIKVPANGNHSFPVSNSIFPLRCWYVSIERDNSRICLFGNAVPPIENLWFLEQSHVSA